MSKILQHRADDTLPASLVSHLHRIKKLVQFMNSDLKDDYLANMLNKALKQRTRSVGLQAYAKALADDSFPQKLTANLEQLDPAKLRGFKDLLKSEGGQGCMTMHALMVLLEDGLHPLASLSGWIVGESARQELETRDSGLLSNNRLEALFPNRHDVMSPFYQPALLMMEQRRFWASISPQRAARQLHRFAQHLSQDNDLLCQLHFEFFDPSSRANPDNLSELRLRRTRPLENRLQWSIGRVLDLNPDLDNGLIPSLKWPSPIVRNWVMRGHIAELGSIHPAEFESEIARNFKILPAIAIHYLPIYDGGHPLAHVFEQACLEFHQTAERFNTSSHQSDDMVATHPHEVVFRPDLAKKIGWDYTSLHQELFNDFWQHCQLDFIDYALSEFSETWGRPSPANDPGLISVNAIGLHPQWLKNNQTAIGDQLEPLLQSKSTVPQALLKGKIPLSTIPDNLVNPFAKCLVSSGLSVDGFKRIDELVESGRIAPEDVLAHVQTTATFRRLAGNRQLKSLIIEHHSETVAEEVLAMDLGI